uniref:Uncharacterized protein n=1 Tax=Micrurus corallinus TaxID=54390 RepID=A0A2D4EMB3_MICCO
MGQNSFNSRNFGLNCGHTLRTTCLKFSSKFPSVVFLSSLSKVHTISPSFEGFSWLPTFSMGGDPTWFFPWDSAELKKVSQDWTGKGNRYSPGPSSSQRNKNITLQILFPLSNMSHTGVRYKCMTSFKNNNKEL